MSLTRTRHTKRTGLWIANLGPRHWQHWHKCPASGDAAVGPIYASKAEALADHERYAREWGGTED